MRPANQNLALCCNERNFWMVGNVVARLLKLTKGKE